MDKISLLPSRLKELRLQHNLTQAQLGEKVGVKQNTFTNWENGKRTPSIEDIIKLSILLDVSIDYLLGLTDSKPSYIDPNIEDEKVRTEVALLEINDLLVGIYKEALETNQSIESIITSLSINERTKKLYSDLLNFARYEYFGNNSETTDTE
ncbi:helix-turn-helix domain-containing protein [Streptococcus suis]